MKHHNFFILAFLLLAAYICQGQVVVTAYNHDNTTNTYHISPSGNINFTNNQMIISEDGLSTSLITLDVDQLKKVTFSNQSNTIITPSSTAVPMLYPNPAMCYITLQGIGSTPTPVTIYSVSGKQLRQQLCQDGSTIDVSTLPSGLYFVRIDNHIIKLAIK